MAIYTNKEKRNTSPHSSSSSTGSTSSSSSSNSSSSSSSDSSSDTERSSIVSTRSRSTRASSESDGTSSQKSLRSNKSVHDKKDTRKTPTTKQRTSSISKKSSSSHSQPPRTTTSNKSSASVNNDTSKKKKSLFSPDISSDSEPEIIKQEKSHSSHSNSQKSNSTNSYKHAPNSSRISNSQKSISTSHKSSSSSHKPTSNSQKSVAVSHKASSSSQRPIISSPKFQKSNLKKTSEISTSKSKLENNAMPISVSSGSDSESTWDRVRGRNQKKSEPVIGRNLDESRSQDSNERRFVTRSSTGEKLRKSSHLGSNRNALMTNGPQGQDPKNDFDSWSNQKYSNKEINSKSKSGQISAKIQNEMIDFTPLPPIEQRNCPVDGCNSTGHLGGLYDRHYTVDACPIYHNFSKEQCKKNREKRLEDNDERTRFKQIYKERSNPSAEQKNYCNMIRDSRDSMSEMPRENPDEMESDREPCLKGLCPDWDLNLFMQAQATASEKTEDEMRGLPDTKGIRYVQMGRYEMEAWYQSQYPDDYNQQPKIYVCEFCLKYMRSKTILNRHADKCVWKHPPGDEIYRKDKLSVWEVDGTKYKTYCQNLCLLAMLFLDHKTLYYDVEPFLFYIMSIGDGEGCHIVGYFSKEKNSFLNFNVSCIMTLPPYQRQGYGRLLIDFSYLLTKEEGKIGSPEKPLSDLGLISYRSYWKDLLLKCLSGFNQKNICIRDLSAEMAVNSYDIVSTFQAMGMMKYWKGKHILLKRQDLFEDFEQRQKKRRCEQREIDPKYLDWTPYVYEPKSGDKSKNNKNNNTVSNGNNTPSSKLNCEKKVSP